MACQIIKINYLCKIVIVLEAQSYLSSQLGPNKMEVPCWNKFLMKVVTQKSNRVGVWFNTFTRAGLEKTKTKKKTTPEIERQSEWCSVATNPSNWGADSVAAIWDLKG